MDERNGGGVPGNFSYRFGSVAHRLGFVSLPQLQQAISEQVEDDVLGLRHRLLGKIIREKNWITEEQERAILAEMERMEK